MPAPAPCKLIHALEVLWLGCSRVIVAALALVTSALRVAVVIAVASVILQVLVIRFDEGAVLVQVNRKRMGLVHAGSFAILDHVFALMIKETSSTLRASLPAMTSFVSMFWVYAVSFLVRPCSAIILNARLFVAVLASVGSFVFQRVLRPSKISGHGGDFRNWMLRLRCYLCRRWHHWNCRWDGCSF